MAGHSHAGANGGAQANLGPPLALSDLPWAQNELTDVEQKALESLQRIERAHQDIAQVVLSFPWLADSITEDEQLALSYLREIASFVSLFGASIPDISEIIGETWWLIDGITEKESLFLGKISAIQDPSTMRVSLLANSPDDYTPSAPTPAPTPTPAPPSDPSGFPWAQDGLTDLEREALGFLQNIESKYPDTYEVVLGFPWLSDGVTGGERLLLCHISTAEGSGTARAIAQSTPPSETLPDCPATQTTPTPAPAPTAEPTPVLQPALNVTPLRGSPDDVVSVSGTNFPRLTAVSRIEIGGVSVIPVTPPRTTADGGFSVSVVVPKLDVGTYSLVVAVGDRTIVATFSVVE